MKCIVERLLNGCPMHAILLMHQLLGKEEVLVVFREVEAETDVDESVDEMLFPAFLEVIARCALMVGRTFEHKMEKASPTEIPFLKSFLSVCCPELQVTSRRKRAVCIMGSSFCLPRRLLHPMFG